MCPCSQQVMPKNQKHQPSKVQTTNRHECNSKPPNKSNVWPPEKNLRSLRLFFTTQWWLLNTPLGSWDSPKKKQKNLPTHCCLLWYAMCSTIKSRIFHEMLAEVIDAIATWHDARSARASMNHGNLKGKPRVNTRLIRPYFWGGVALEGPL